MKGQTMRSHVTAFGFLAAVLLAVVPSRSDAATGALSCPGTADPGSQFQIEVTIDVGTTPLGAYAITLTYDPAVVTIAQSGVVGGNTAEFQTQPITNSTKFNTGSTPI